MTTSNLNAGLPDHLASLQALAQHFRAQLEDLSKGKKGYKFAQFVQMLILWYSPMSRQPEAQTMLMERGV